MNFAEFKNLVIAECESKGITEYELYYQMGESTSVDTFQHAINEFTSSIDGGICFRSRARVRRFTFSLFSSRTVSSTSDGRYRMTN